MDKQKNSIMKLMQHILGIMTIGAFLFFVLGELLLPAENVSGDSTCRIFEADWEEVLQDGSRVPVTVPGTCESEQGEWVTIVTTLSDSQEDTCLCVRSMQQDMRIYVGDELRKEYSTLETQPFGKTSTMTYVFFEVYASDAGKQLRIEFMSDSNYSGYVSEIYTGEYSDITKYFYGLYAPSAIVAAFMLLTYFL